MYYKKMETKDLTKDRTDNKEIVDLLQKGSSYLKFIIMKKDESFDSHVFDSDAFIYMTDGEIELKFDKEEKYICGICGCEETDKNSEEERKYKLKKNEFFMFEKGVRHTIKAIKDSGFFAVKI